MSAASDIIVGIDLGTTNSLVAYCDERGPRVLDDGTGPLLPSVVSFDPRTGSTVVGKIARDHAVELPTTTVYSIKRLMGRGYADLSDEIAHLPYTVVRRAEDEPPPPIPPLLRGGSGGSGRDLAAVQIGDRTYTPPEISAMILGVLRERAMRHFGHDVARAVITVPAYFDDAQRQATRDAGQIAGLDVVRLVNEPTAAALAYGLDRAKHGTVAVYDLGGGTFDISILSLHEGIFEVHSTHGDTHLGGDDFDRRIMNLARREIQQHFGVDIESPSIMQTLRNYAEAVKIALSSHRQQTLSIDLGKERVYERVIERAEFEAMLAPFVERTLASCRQALRAAKKTVEEIDEVVLVGGSTRIPYVRHRVEEFFGRLPYTALDPDQVVALGAAVQASILAGARQDTLLLDVTPLSLGVETLGGAMGKLIPANQRVPCKAKETFTTFQDGQTAVKFNVLQGERELAADCRSLGVFELRGIPPMPAGMPKIDVTFLIDQNGILNVFAKEQRSGVEASIQVVPSHGLTREEVAKMQADSVKHAVADMSAHRLIDLRNQVTFDTTKAEQMLAAHGHLLSAEERRSIDQGIADLRAFAARSTDNNEIHRRLQAFGENTRRLAELGIAESLKTAMNPS